MNINKINPSTLKITDMRFADIDGAPKRCTLMKLYTNQGLVGYMQRPRVISSLMSTISSAQPVRAAPKAIMDTPSIIAENNLFIIVIY